MQCPNCEADNREGAKFCDECGFPLSGAIAHAARYAPPARTAQSSQQEERASDGNRERDEVPESFDQGFSAGDEESADATGMLDASRTAVSDEAHAKPEAPRDSLDHDDRRDWSMPSEPDAPAATAQGVRQEQDPFIGYSLSADDDFGFPAAETPADVRPSAGEGSAPESTMQMPRVKQEQQPASRDFRIAPSPERGSRKRVVGVVIAGIAAGIALAALVTYLLGLWGGIAVPDVVGMTESDARAALEEEGFAVRSTQVKSDDTEGLVLVMDPAGGSRAAEGSEVVIHISTARFLPDVTGKSEAEARSLMEESGYENVSYEKEKSEGEEGIVLSVDPEAGTRAKSNAQIVVKVSEAYSVPDVSNLDLASAEQAIADSGLVYGVVFVDTDQYEDGTILGTEPAAGTKVEKDSYVSINVSRKRGAELIALTGSMLAAGQTVTIGGVDYEIQSLDSVNYEGDDVVSFSVTALPRTTFFGKTIYADQQVVSGQVIWSESNEVISIS